MSDSTGLNPRPPGAQGRAQPLEEATSPPPSSPSHSLGARRFEQEIGATPRLTASKPSSSPPENRQGTNRTTPQAAKSANRFTAAVRAFFDRIAEGFASLRDRCIAIGNAIDARLTRRNNKVEKLRKMLHTRACLYEEKRSELSEGQSLFYSEHAMDVRGFLYRHANGEELNSEERKDAVHHLKEIDAILGIENAQDLKRF